MKVPFVDLKAQYRGMEENILSLIKEVMDDSDYVYSKKIDAFEEKITNYLGLRKDTRAITVSSGTTALETCLKAVGIRPLDKVLVPSNTFIATAFAVSNVGAIPVFFDVDPNTWVWDANQVLDYLDDNSGVVAAMPVHLYGLPVPGMESFVDGCNSRRVRVVEDCAQAFGAETEKGSKVGTLGHCNAFSFYPAKNLGTLGNGGLVASKFSFFNDRARLYKNYGESEKYFSDIVGNNHNLSTIQAVVLSLFLDKIDEWNISRVSAGKMYRNFIDNSKVLGENVVYQKGLLHTNVYHLFVIKVSPEKRDLLMQRLREKDVGVGIHYPLPVQEQKAYCGPEASLSSSVPCPVSEALTRSIISLPMHPNLTEDQISYVCETIEGFFNG
jgi:dTDP-4-amino-4,6-dideoxygalactose transaminase